MKEWKKYIFHAVFLLITGFIAFYVHTVEKDIMRVEKSVETLKVDTNENIKILHQRVTKVDDDTNDRIDRIFGKP
jgi:hypothetical protein